jgi:hypothetical protein
MRERGVAFLLALAALVAFYALWLRPAPSLDPDAGVARPTSAERRGNGYAALDEWLRREKIDVRSWRDRYTRLAGADLATRGNLLVLTLPAAGDFHNDEFAALDRWIRGGNTLLINAALLDQPDWADSRSAGAAAEVETLTALEFERRARRERRLDPTPLAERVRRADARRAEAERKRNQDSDDDEGEVDGAQDDENSSVSRVLDAPESIPLTVTGPHPLLAGVKTLAFETDSRPEDWSLRLPVDSFVLTLARGADGEGALFEQRIGDGRLLLVAGASLFTNRALGDADNARLMSNIVAQSVGAGGAVLFDDLRQGLSSIYDPDRLYGDPRLIKSIVIVLVLWFVWVLGSTRLRPPPKAMHDPSEADLVRHAGGLIARTVAPHRTALRLYDRFFMRIARVARAGGSLTGGGRAAERGELWSWLERHAAILPQELDRLKTWYADAHSERKVPVQSLHTLLDTLEKRLKT